MAMGVDPKLSKDEMEEFVNKRFRQGAIDADPAGTGTSQSSVLAIVKQELAPPPKDQQAKMIARMHYMKKQGEEDAWKEYSGLDVQGKRAWFFNVYSRDPSLSRYTGHHKTRQTYGTDQSKEAEEWLTEKQIMAGAGYTDEKDVNYDKVKDALLEGLEVRDHENAGMAALGFKQYQTFKRTFERLHGSTKADTLHMEHEISGSDAKAIRDVFDNGGIALPEAPAPERIMIEAWKKDAMDLERRLTSLTSRGDKLSREAMKIIFKLKELEDSAGPGHALAKAQKEEIQDKIPVFEKAGKDFFTEYNKYNSKTADDAKVQMEKTEDIIKVYKAHIAQFEKLLNLGNKLLAMNKV